jgi:L-alanine-DL-glutamate epimerase-like enolase superfamily enzyme
MKISDYEILLVDSGVRATVSEKVELRPTNIIVRLRTEEGLEGVGGATANLAGEAVAIGAAALRPMVVGEDPRYRERIWHSIFDLSIAMLPPQAMAAVDCALWDLAGKHAAEPIHRMLGAFRDRVPCYVSTPTYGTVDAYLAEIRGCLGAGFKAVKLHGWGDPQRDVELCEAVRAEVGPEVALMLDAVGAYDLPGAMKVGRALEKLDFEWFEMPIRDQGMLAYRQLAAALDIPITSGEVHHYPFHEAANYLAGASWDFSRIDAAISGGITGARKAAALAEGFGLRCELHSFGYTLAMAANLQVAGAIANCSYFELPLPLGTYDVGMAQAIHVDDKGDAHVPLRPGLGVEVDWPEMEQLVVARY